MKTKTAEQTIADGKVLEALGGFPQNGLVYEGVVDHAYGTGCGQIERANTSGALRRLEKEGSVQRVEDGSCCVPLPPRYLLVA